MSYIISISKYRLRCMIIHTHDHIHVFSNDVYAQYYLLTMNIVLNICIYLFEKYKPQDFLGLFTLVNIKTIHY